MIARRSPRKRRQKVSMRRINPIEWTSGCSHSPATGAGARSCAAANCIPQTLGAAEDAARPPTPRATQHSERHGNGNAEAVLQHLPLASTRAVTTAGIETERDGNTRSPSSRSPIPRGLSIGPSLTFARRYACSGCRGRCAECPGLVVSALPGHRRVDETPHRTPARARRPLRRCGLYGRSARAACVPAQGPAA